MKYATVESAINSAKVVARSTNRNQYIVKVGSKYEFYTKVIGGNVLFTVTPKGDVQ